MNDSNALRALTPEVSEYEETAAKTVAPANRNLRKGSKDGAPGNIGGLGVQPSYVRERCRRSFLTLVPELERIATSAKAEDRDVIRAIDTLGRYGLMTGRLDLEEVRARLHRTIGKIEELCDPDTAARILSAIDPIWNPRKG